MYFLQINSYMQVNVCDSAIWSMKENRTVWIPSLSLSLSVYVCACVCFPLQYWGYGSEKRLIHWRSPLCQAHGSLAEQLGMLHPMLTRGQSNDREIEKEQLEIEGGWGSYKRRDRLWKTEFSKCIHLWELQRWQINKVNVETTKFTFAHLWHHCRKQWKFQ